MGWSRRLSNGSMTTADRPLSVTVGAPMTETKCHAHAERDGGWPDAAPHSESVYAGFFFLNCLDFLCTLTPMINTEQLLALIPEAQFSLPYLGVIDVTPYLGSLIVFLVLSGIFYIVRTRVLVHLRSLSKRIKGDLDDTLVQVIESIHSWFYSVLALFIALQLLTLPAWLDIGFTVVFLFLVVWEAIRAASTFIEYGAQKFIEKDEDGDGEVDPNAATASSMVRLFSQIVLWALGGLFILSNLGIEVTSLLAGLGIGGIAIAFALQNILGDLFSSFSLYLDKPFRVGDYIVIGEHSGTVEKIGVKTTRIRTLQGEELVIANSELTSSRVQNFKRMSERRVSFRFGVLYETSRERVARIPDLVRAAFETCSHGRFDHVHFVHFGDSALEFEVVYYVDSPEYADYLDLQQEFNLNLMEQFENEGIEFAYPTQTLYIKK